MERLARADVDDRRRARLDRLQRVDGNVADLDPVGPLVVLAGEGEGGAAGGPPGDLYVFIEVTEHPFFRREGNNLSCEIPLNFTTLALGGW